MKVMAVVTLFDIYLGHYISQLLASCYALEGIYLRTLAGTPDGLLIAKSADKTSFLQCPPVCIRTYAVIVVGKDEAVVTAAVEGPNCVAASSIPTGVSLTLIYV